MKQSILGICASLIQKEIEFYANFTSLEYDINDENTIRVAGTGIFRSIIYANEHYPYSAIEQAKQSHRLTFASGRNCSICRKCDTRHICTALCEMVLPLYIDNIYIGSISMLCYKPDLRKKMLEHPSHYQSLLTHLSQILISIAESVLAKDTLNITQNTLISIINNIKDGVLLLENKHLLQTNETMSGQLHHLGFSLSDQKNTWQILKDQNSSSISLHDKKHAVSLDGKYQFFGSKLFAGKRLEYVVTENSPLSGSQYFQDMSPESSMDYYKGNSEIVTCTKELAVKTARISRYFVIQGERGLGKERWARSLNNSSGHSNDDFMVFDCNAFSDFSFAEQIFNEEQGIFCNQNLTICLKEISRMPYWLQTKAAEQAMLMEKNNIRLIATSMEDLASLKDKNVFSKQLFNLFYPAIIHIPPIRDRGGDVDFYIQNYFDQYQKQNQKKVACSAKALSLLRSFSWPGNFKQMSRIINYLISINTKGVIEEEDILELPDFKNISDSYNLKEHEKELISQALNQFTGPYAKEVAAKALGIGKATLYRKIQEYHL